MGAELVRFYDQCKIQGGLSAQLRLATLTRLAGTKALEAPDSPENLKIFEAAYAEVMRELRMQRGEEKLEVRRTEEPPAAEGPVEEVVLGDGPGTQ
jgi:hypothetical protein